VILIAEFFLGGAGHFVEFYGLSIRTTLLIAFLILYLISLIARKEKIKYRKSWLVYSLIGLLAYLFALAIYGLFQSHPISFIFQDIIPFAFLLLLIPSFYPVEYSSPLAKNNFLSDKKFIPRGEFAKKKKAKKIILQLLVAFVIGSAIFSLFNFVLYRTGASEIHDGYYLWLRNVNAAKITKVTDFYYRIVFPEHLLIVPIMLILAAFWLKRDHLALIRANKGILIALLTGGGLIMALNVSRAYFLGLIIGLLFLKCGNRFWPWLKKSVGVLLIIFLIFTAINLISSGGKYHGWEILGIRFLSISSPQMEVSTNTRMQLLPPILDLIKERPIFGQGLGQDVTFELNGELKTTRHFDWGYFEMLAKWGVIGLALFLLILGLIITKTKKWLNQPLILGATAGLIALLIINITTPALFHVFGILYLVFILSIIKTHVS